MSESPSPDLPGSDDERSPRRANILAVLVIVLVIVGILLWKEGDSGTSGTTGTGAAASPADDNARAAHLSKVISQVSAAWDARNKQRFVSAAGSSKRSRQWATQTYANLRALHVRDFHARLIAEGAGGIQPDGTFAADVAVSWTPGKSSGLNTTTTEPSEVKMEFRPSADGYDVWGVQAGDDPIPLWLAGNLKVERKGKSNVVYVDPKTTGRSKRLAPKQLEKMSRRAHRAVRSVVGHQVGQSMVVVPEDASQSSELLGQPELGQIAAVTTTIDGSTKDTVAAYVVLNPAVFADLGRRAAQVVLTHEATHALTGVEASSMPPWVAEGFADYVALNDDHLGVSKSASQILAKVRKDGPPKHLPAAKDFGAGRQGLGATYESAWLIFEVLHLRAGDDALVDFYTQVRDGRKVGRALQEDFGLDVNSLTALWRDYLRSVAAR